MRLIDQIQRDGIDVAVAFWARIEDDRPWHLYLAASAPQRSDLAPLYRRVYASLGRIGPSWINPSDLTLLDSDDSAAVAARELRDQNLVPGATWFGAGGGRRLGDMSVREAYIYPEIRPVRVLYFVDYTRQQENHWSARVKTEGIFRNTTARGAVGFSWAEWADDPDKERRHAIVSVLVAVDPSMINPDWGGESGGDFRGMFKDPSISEVLGTQAKSMADALFHRHHPDAVIISERQQPFVVGA